MQLHCDLGHASKNKLALILATGQINGLTVKDLNLLVPCAGCLLGNPRRKSHPLSKEERDVKYFGSHVSADCTGEQPVRSKAGKRVLLALIDHYSNWKWGIGLASKSDSTGMIAKIIRRLKLKLKVLRTDKGGEFCGAEMERLKDLLGFKQEKAATGVSQHNGKAEKCIQDIMGPTRTNLQEACVGLSFWVESNGHATYTLNRLPCYANPDCKSPYEMRFGRRPNYKKMIAFGQAVTVMYKKAKVGSTAPDKKLGAQAMYGMMCGYNEDINGVDEYRVYVPALRRIVCSPEVTPLNHMIRTSNPAPDVSQLVNAPGDEHFAAPASTLAPVNTDDPAPPTMSAPPVVMAPVLRPRTVRTATIAPPGSVPAATITAPTATIAPPNATPAAVITEPVVQPVAQPQVQQQQQPRRSSRLRGRHVPVYNTDTTFCECMPGEEINVPSNTFAHINVVSVKDTRKAFTVVTPKTIKEAMQSLDWENGWQPATAKELMSLLVNETYTVVERKDVPKHVHIVSTRWVFKVKPSADGSISVFKARVVARGFLTKPGIDYDKTFSPVAQATTIRLLLAIAVSRGLHLRSADFVTAFLHAKRQHGDKTVYVWPPEGSTDYKRGLVWLLRKAIYGLKDSPYLFHRTLVNYLKKYGYKQSKMDPCLMYRITKEEYTLLTLVVDDLLIATLEVKHADGLINQLKQYFKVKDLGKPKYTVGMHIEYARKARKLTLNQRLYIETIAERFGQTNAKPTKSPADRGLKLTKDMGGPPCGKEYRQLVGALVYCVHTRPDVANIISELSRFLDCAQSVHYKAAIRVLRYLYTTRTKSLLFAPKLSPGSELDGFADSTYNSTEESRARDGRLCRFNMCPVGWRSRIQSIITLSSCEAEYVALNECLKEIIWLRQLLKEIGYPQSTTTVFCDNQGTIALANNKMSKQRTKHIRVRYHWNRDVIERKEVKLVYCPSADDIADMFTKNLGFFALRDHLLKTIME